jgi:hypothetical protein
VSQWQSGREIPLCDAARVSNAEKSQSSRHKLVVCIPAIRLLCPRQPLYASVLAAIEYLLLQPSIVSWVPYFNVAIRASNRKSQRFRIFVPMFGFGMRECERIDCRGRVRYKSRPMDIHICLEKHTAGVYGLGKLSASLVSRS